MEIKAQLAALKETERTQAAERVRGESSTNGRSARRRRSGSASFSAGIRKNEDDREHQNDLLRKRDHIEELVRQAEDATRSAPKILKTGRST